MENKTNKIQIIVIVILLLISAGSTYYAFTKSCKAEPTTKAELTQGELNLSAAMGGAEGKSSLVDLNNDGQLDLIIQPIGGNYCGTGGCATMIFKNTGKNLELINEISLTRDFYVLQTSTNGWLDLATLQSGGGMPEAKYKMLQFNGANYPDSAENGIEIQLDENSKKIF